MTRWERLDVCWEKGIIWVAPAKKVNLQWIEQHFPSSKVELDKVGKGMRIEVKPLGVDVETVYYAVLDYVGANGWEPYAVSTYFFRHISHFRRPMMGENGAIEVSSS